MFFFSKIKKFHFASFKTLLERLSDDDMVDDSSNVWIFFSKMFFFFDEKNFENFQSKMQARQTKNSSMILNLSFCLLAAATEALEQMS
jgi:hypothetical protein